MIRFRLNNDTGIAGILRFLDTRFQKSRNVCGNRILRTWRECKTKAIHRIERQIPVKRLKRNKEFVRIPIEAPGLVPWVVHKPIWDSNPDNIESKSIALPLC